MKKTFYLLTFLTAVIVLFPQCQQASQEKKAKYVFYFIGDGMGVNQVNGTEMYLAEKEGYIGIKPLNFTQFPVTNFATTYSKYNSVTCSAASGTALASGIGEQLRQLPPCLPAQRPKTTSSAWTAFGQLLYTA